MTRSEERLHVGTEQVEAGRARLRKYVVTENVTQTVPVSHEEVRLEREPVTDANRGPRHVGQRHGEEEHGGHPRAERPVVDKETVPVERVRLGTETVTEDHEVGEPSPRSRSATPTSTPRHHPLIRAVGHRSPTWRPPHHASDRKHDYKQKTDPAAAAQPGQRRPGGQPR